MAEKYLDKEGVQILWNKVKGQIANSSGGSGSIPTVDLNSEGGTLTSEQLAIVKNNRIVNFRIAQGGGASMYCVCIKQEINAGSTSVYAFTSTNTPLSNVFTIAIIEASKTYQLSRSEIIYDVGFNDTQDKINLLGDGNVEIGNGIPLSTLKEKLGITGGSGGDFEIPTITLTPTSNDPISGTLSEKDYTTIQNNDIIKFVVPNTVDAIVSKQVFQGMFMFFFLLGNTIYTLLIESNKSFSISQTQLPLGMRVTGNNLGVYDDAGNLMGGTVSKTQMQEWLEIGGAEVPTLTLTPGEITGGTGQIDNTGIYMSGTLNDGNFAITQNNDTFKISVSGLTIIANFINSSEYGRQFAGYIISGVIFFFTVNPDKTFRSTTHYIADGLKIVGDDLKLYNELDPATFGKAITKSEMRNFVGDRYTISEDGDTLVITENW